MVVGTVSADQSNRCPTAAEGFATLPTLVSMPELVTALSLGRMKTWGWFGECPTIPRYPMPKLSSKLLSCVMASSIEAVLVLRCNLLTREDEESPELLLSAVGVVDPADSFRENILMNGLTCVPGLTESRHRTGLL